MLLHRTFSPPESPAAVASANRLRDGSCRYWIWTSKARNCSKIGLRCVVGWSGSRHYLRTAETCVGPGARGGARAQSRLLASFPTRRLHFLKAPCARVQMPFRGARGRQRPIHPDTRRHATAWERMGSKQSPSYHQNSSLSPGGYPEVRVSTVYPSAHPRSADGAHGRVAGGNGEALQTNAARPQSPIPGHLDNGTRLFPDRWDIRFSFAQREQKEYKEQRV